MTVSTLTTLLDVRLRERDDCALRVADLQRDADDLRAELDSVTRQLATARADLARMSGPRAGGFRAAAARAVALIAAERDEERCGRQCRDLEQRLDAVLEKLHREQQALRRHERAVEASRRRLDSAADDALGEQRRQDQLDADEQTSARRFVRRSDPRHEPE